MRALLSRWPLRSPLALAAAGVALVLAQLLVLAVERRAEWTSPIGAAELMRRGFELTPEGASRAIETADGLHQLALPILLRRYRDYEVRFDVLDTAKRRVELCVDLFAPDYDHSKQDRRESIGPESVGRRMRLRINSGDAPADGYLRLFYVGPPGLTVADIHFRQISLLRSMLERGNPLLACACLMLAAWLAILRAALPDAGRGVAEIDARIDPAWALLAIYLSASLGHFVLHLFAPFWSGDEARYRAVASVLWQLGRSVPISADVFNVPVDLPNMLYPHLIAPAFAAGDGFYVAVRLINALAMCTVVFPTFWIARSYLPRSAGLFVAALSAAIPFVNLAAYAVTEVLFYPLYVTAAWLTLESLVRTRRAFWCMGVGLAAALLLNTRPTGIVVIPAFLLCYAWNALRSGSGRDLVHKPAWLLAPATFVPSFIGLQWLTGVQQIGRPGIYGRSVEQGSDVLENLLSNPEGLLDLALGHVTTLSIPFALPIALIVWRGLFGGRDGRASRSESLHIVNAVFFAALFALTLVFTVAVSATDLGGLGRWHSRYYFPAYALLILSFASLLSGSMHERAKNRGVWVTVALALGIHCWFMDFRAASDSPWFTSIVDNMDAQWYGQLDLGRLRWPMLAATGLLTGLWYRSSRWLRPLSVALSLVWILTANFGTARVMAIGSPVTPDPCGKLLSTFLELRPGRFAVFGSTQEFRTAAAFWNPYLPEQTLASETMPAYLASASAGELDFILTDAELPADPRYRLQVDGGACLIYASVRP